MFHSDRAQAVIDHALGLGADFVELFVERQLRSSVQTLSGKVKDVSSGIDFGIGLRLIFDGKVLYGYSNRDDTRALMRIADELAARDRQGAQSRPLALEVQTVASQHPAQRILSRDPEVADKVEFLLAADRQARQSGAKVEQITGHINQREQAVAIFNSEGLAVEDCRHYSLARVSVLAQEAGQQASGTDQSGALMGWELAEGLNPESMGEEAARQALVNLSAKACPSGRMPVVIGPGFGGVIFHEACGHLLETTAVAKQASVFHDKLGEMIASPVVSAVDDGTLANAWGSINLDDEGMPTQRTQLIKNGRLENFLVDRQGARQTGHPRSGSGRRESYRYAPASRMRNTFIEAGDSDLDSMIGSMERGIYAAKMGGGSVQPGTGEFNFAVTEGYYVEKGKIQYPVKAATLISTGPQVLRQISQVGSDLALSPGMCGSISGSVPVTVGQPALKVDEILVGGNA